MWESVVADQVDVQIVFEDDARPSPRALPALFEQILLLDTHGACSNRAAWSLFSGVPWDLVYLRSAKYDVAPEKPCQVPGSLLLHVRALTN